MSERLRYPGYRYAYGSTVGYPPGKAKGPFTWITYSQPDEDNMSDREQGYVDTVDEARELATGRG